MASVTPPRGMRDFLPTEARTREHLLRLIRDRYRAHGFDAIETPVMEEYGRLHAGLGGDNEKLAFNVLRRGLGADAIRAAADGPAGPDAAALCDLGLRYDLTVPLARFYATHQAALPTVFRALQVAPVWRAERPQKGRFRQFVQCDIDVIGDASPRAEAELLVATLDALDVLGLSGAEVRLNDRRLLEGMLRGFGFTPDEDAAVLITLDKLDKIGALGVIAELHARSSEAAAVDRLAEFLRADPGTPSAVTATALRARLPDGADDSVVDGIVEIAEAVTAACGDAGTPLVFDPFLVRGMGYYTGTIFEVAHPSVDYSLGGGGRYDDMVGRFLGRRVPAVGFSLGFERIAELVAADGVAAEESIVLVHDPDIPLGDLLALKASFADRGVRVRLERRPKNLRALLDRAAADGYGTFAHLPVGATADDLEIRPLG